MDTMDTMDTSSRGWTLSASEVCALIKAAGDDDEDAQVVESATPSRVGRVLSHLRIQKGRAANNKRSRGRQFTLPDIRRLALGYGIETILTAQTSVDSCPDTLELVSIVSIVSTGDDGHHHEDANLPPDLDGPQAATLADRVLTALNEMGEAGWPTLAQRLRVTTGAVRRECEKLVTDGRLQRLPGERYALAEPCGQGGRT